MATTKTTNRTNTEAGTKRAAALAGGKLVVATDSHAFTTTELDDNGGIVLTDVRVPSNAVIRDVKQYNDDLDLGSGLTLDYGVFATTKFTSVTSGAATIHEEGDMLDADLLVDGDGNAAAATTNFISLGLDSASMGPDDIDKPVWELLGYDEDPNTVVGVALTIGAATSSQAGDLAIQVEYLVN